MFNQSFSPETSDQLLPADLPEKTEFELSDYLVFEGGSEDSEGNSFGLSQNPVSPENGENSCENTAGNTSKKKYGSVLRNMKVDVGFKVGFRTMSELEILDDGFKWRKYGKKYVKNNSNPRNYFRCSNGGCQVKKRIERDRDDSRFVITTYVGVHNHESPCIIYYTPQPAFDLGSSTHIPLMAPSSWVLQAAHSSS